MLLNVVECCWMLQKCAMHKAFSQEITKIDRKSSVRLFSQEITKFHKKSSVRLFPQEITKIDKKSSVRLLSQEITKLDKRFSVRLFPQEITISQELFCRWTLAARVVMNCWCWRVHNEKVGPIGVMVDEGPLHQLRVLARSTPRDMFSNFP